MKKKLPALYKALLIILLTLSVASVVLLAMFHVSCQRVVAHGDVDKLCYNGNTYTLCTEPDDVEMDTKRIGIVEFSDNTTARIYKYNGKTDEYLYVPLFLSYRTYKLDKST